MAIYINDAELEKRLADLGKRQAIPVKKTTMAEAILREAVRDERGGPVDAWKTRSRKHSAPRKTSAA